MLCLQLAVVAFASATVFLRVRMPTDTLVDGRKFLAFLFFSIYFMNASAWSELSITVSPSFLLDAPICSMLKHLDLTIICL